MNPKLKNKRTIHAKLIFNPSAGAARTHPIEIVDIIHDLQAQRIVPEPFLVEPGCDLDGAIKQALEKGFRLFIVCGGDGTISAVARILAGTEATLGVIPIGTQNNVPLTFGIPDDIPAAIALLRSGKRVKIDLGKATCGKITTTFLEGVSIGLVADLFPLVDDIQHGNLARIGAFFKTLTSSPPAEINLVMEKKKELHDSGHVVLVTNMPFIGFHYQVSQATSFRDGFLDMIYFADLSKIELLEYIFLGIGMDRIEDPRIQHIRVRKLVIETNPAMSVMADGTELGSGKVTIEVWHHALSVIVNPEVLQKSVVPEKAAE
jgi:diacylglycerol kinase family enzyme